jgi:uncharacterized protein (TIGR00369 family)
VTDLPDDVVRLVEKAIVRSPYAALLGARLEEAAEGRVRVRVPYRGELTTFGDTVHGGVLAGLIDVAATAAFWASGSIAPGARGTTIGFSVSFVSAARGKDLVASAVVRRRGREISTGEVTVSDSEGREVALALVTYKLSVPA